ncbi:MAG: DUF4397 domain-containing protein [Anaerolinea sp.]|nr:DUF4397 domain-containing protein [Anaerolinea sp.]
MRKRIVFLITTLLLSALTLPLSAQEATDTPDSALTSDVTRIQIAHFAPDAPPVVPYVDGQATIGTLSFPGVTGWIEVPSTSFNLTLVPEGAPQSQAVFDPVTVSNSLGGWITLIVAGSLANDSLALYALAQPAGGLNPECARVVVFHGIQGGPTVDLMRGEGGESLGSVMFPGSGMMDPGMMATDEPGMMATDEAGMMMDNPCGGDVMATAEPGDMGMMEYGSGHALQCTLLTTMNMLAAGDAMATDEAGMMATDEPGVMATDMGSSMNNCAFVIDVPAGAGGFGAFAGGTQLGDLANTQFAANTYNFVALIGTGDAPQTFTYVTQADVVDQMMQDEMDRLGGAG